MELKHDRFDESTIEVELLSLVKMLESKCDHCIEIIRMSYPEKHIDYMLFRIG